MTTTNPKIYRLELEPLNHTDGSPYIFEEGSRYVGRHKDFKVDFTLRNGIDVHYFIGMYEAEREPARDDAYIAIRNVNENADDTRRYLQADAPKHFVEIFDGDEVLLDGILYRASITTSRVRNASSTGSLTVPVAAKMSVNWAADANPGKRPQQQDHYGYHVDVGPNEGLNALWLVADGVGASGQYAAEASRFAVEYVLWFFFSGYSFRENADELKKYPQQRLRGAISNTSALLTEYGKKLTERSDPDQPRKTAATTLAALAIVDHGLYAAVVGDALIYRQRRDSAMVDFMAKVQSRDDVLTHDGRLRYVMGNGDQACQIAFTDSVTLPDDTYILSSDGIIDPFMDNILADQKVGQLVMAMDYVSDRWRSLPESLVQQALQNGGEDNMAVIVIRTEKRDDANASVIGTAPSKKANADAIPLPIQEPQLPPLPAPHRKSESGPWWRRLTK